MPDVACSPALPEGIAPETGFPPSSKRKTPLNLKSPPRISARADANGATAIANKNIQPNNRRMLIGLIMGVNQRQLEPWHVKKTERIAGRLEVPKGKIPPFYRLPTGPETGAGIAIEA